MIKTTVFVLLAITPPDMTNVEPGTMHPKECKAWFIKNRPDGSHPHCGMENFAGAENTLNECYKKAALNHYSELKGEIAPEEQSKFACQKMEIRQ